jgi:uncharacterized membrane protein YhiD involved in acid resistance
MKRLECILFAILMSAPLLAQTSAPPGADQRSSRGDILTDSVDRETQLHQLRHAASRLPVAAALACVLALRPRRRGTPRRQAPVIQTQIILAVVGAVVMLVVGASLARAFGIVGAAGLVRYRAKIDDPKDAGVMLSTLAVGLAAGVGLWMLATFATVFVLALLWIVESFEPKAMQVFLLKIKAKDAVTLKPNVEQLLTRHRLKFELRGESAEELTYEMRVPLESRTARLSDQILKLDPANTTAVEWEEKKDKK